MLYSSHTSFLAAPLRPKTSGPLHELLPHPECSSACPGYLHLLTSFKSLLKCHLLPKGCSTFLFSFFFLFFFCYNTYYLRLVSLFFCLLVFLILLFIYCLSLLTRHNSRTLPVLLNGRIPPPPEHCTTCYRRSMLGNRDPGRRKHV